MVVTLALILPAFFHATATCRLPKGGQVRALQSLGSRCQPCWVLRTCKARANPGTLPHMPLVKLNRINKGGEILLNSEHIVFVETEARTTTVHMSDGLLFSVEETPAAIAERIERIEVSRFKDAMVEGGTGSPPAG